MQKNKSVSSFNITYLIADLILLIVIFFSLLYLKYEETVTIPGLIKAHYKALALLILFWMLSADYLKLYHSNRFYRLIVVFKRIFLHIFLFSVILFAISGLKKEDLFSVEFSSIFLSIILVFLLISRSIGHFIHKYYRKKGYDNSRIIIIGNNDNAANLKELINDRKDLGLTLFKHLVTKNASGDQILVDNESLDLFLSENKINYAYLCLGNGIDEDQINSFTEVLEKRYVSLGFIPNTKIELQRTLDINYLDAFPILTYRKYPLDEPFNKFAKRLFDIVMTLVVFVLLLWWLLPIISIAVYLSQGNPILFKQKRNGLNGEVFECYKFRTMRDDKDNNKKPTERDDPRVTKLGRILRKTSLDELPQFFNVLKGEMSIVGPRPHMVSENESYSEIIRRYSLRHYVKPGITGLAQIRGYRGAVDTEKDMELRVRTDIYYVRNWSFLLDLLIIYRTVTLILKGDENAI